MKRKFLLIITLFLTLLSLTSCDWDTWVEQFNKMGDDTYEVYVNMKDKPTLNLLYPNSGMQNTEFRNSWTTRYFERITGYKATYEQIIGTTEDTVSNYITTEEPYHMIKMESGAYFGLLNASGGNKNFANLKPALDEYGQDLYEIIPQEAWDAVTDPETGKIYAIPEIGFSGMLGNALVWNTAQLEEVGITKIPETITEVDTALHALQDHFGAIDDTYHAFAMASAQAYISTLAAAWELPENFYVNDEGKVEHVMYHPQYLPYMSWLNGLVREKILSTAWKTYASSDMISNFALGKLGCAYLNYWSINALAETYAAQQSVSEEEARDIIGWNTYVLGDGNFGTVIQSEPKYVSYYSIGYYCCVPFYMKDYAPYVIDWINQRIKTQAFEGYRLGDEGVNYEYVDANDPDAIEVTISGETRYVKVLPQYEIDILPTSMYQTGVNPTVGINLWILSERTYNAWDVLVPITGPNAIGNALSLAPYIDGWSSIDIRARSWVLTQEQGLINADRDVVFNGYYKDTKSYWETQWWTKDVSDNVQAWHNSKSN